jgi:hypothetical protein
VATERNKERERERERGEREREEKKRERERGRGRERERERERGERHLLSQVASVQNMKRERQRQATQYKDCKTITCSSFR